MENEVKLESAEDFREAIGVLAKAIAELEAVVRAQGELLRAQDKAIQALAKIQTSDHILLEYMGARKGSRDVD